MALERPKESLSGSPNKSKNASKGSKSGGREDKGSNKSHASSPADTERQRLAADLLLAQGRVQAAEAAVKHLQYEAVQQRALQEQAEHNCNDIIAAQQHESRRLTEEVRRLGKALAEAQEVLARREQELDVERKAAVADEETLSEEDEATHLRRLLWRGQAAAAAAASVAEGQQLQLKQRISYLMAEADRAAEKVSRKTLASVM